MSRGLTRETLITTALDIVDREGLGALSMRRLGAELGVDPMAAYRHLPNKEALLDGVVEAAVTETDLATDPALDWRGQLRQLVDSNLRAMLAHPNVVPLLAQRPLTTPRSLLLVERALEITSAAGIPLKDAVLAINSMGMLAAGIAIGITSSAASTRTAEDMRDIFGGLPAETFPLIVDAMRTGQFIESYDELLDFWTEALFDRLERARDSASGKPTGR